MIKFVLIQPAHAHYRTPIFDLLSSHFDVLFVFLSGLSIYPSAQKLNIPWRTCCLNRERNRLWALQLFHKLIYIDADIFLSSLPNSLQSFIALIVARLRSKPLVLWTENWNLAYEYLNRPTFYRKLRVLQYSFMLKQASAIIVPGLHSYRQHCWMGFSADKIHIANQCSIDLHSLRFTNALSKAARIGKTHSTILYLSRIIPRKGLDILLCAFEKLQIERSDLRLVVAGDGDFRPYCERLAAQLHLKNVRFVGAVPFHQAGLYYDAADVFVLPSCLRDHCEGWGLAVNEAMSMSKPIIVTDAVGAAYDLVQEGVNGYIAKSDDVESMYSALARIFDDRTSLVWMGRNSRRIFEAFNDYEKMLSGFSSAIFQVIDRRSQRN